MREKICEKIFGFSIQCPTFAPCRRTTVSAFAQFVSWFVEFCIYTVIMASHMMSEDVTLTNSGWVLGHSLAYRAQLKGSPQVA